MSTTKTPYAVICKQHGQQFLSEQQYNQQMMKPFSRWTCPVCHSIAEWDDDNFDQFYNETFGDDEPAF